MTPSFIRTFASDTFAIPLSYTHTSVTAVVLRSLFTNICNSRCLNHIRVNVRTTLRATVTDSQGLPSGQNHAWEVSEKWTGNAQVVRAIG